MGDCLKSKVEQRYVVTELYGYHNIFYVKTLFKQSLEDPLIESPAGKSDLQNDDSAECVERLKKYRAKYRLSASKGVTAMERVAL